MRWALLLLDEKIACAMVSARRLMPLDVPRRFAGLGVVRTRKMAGDRDRTRREIVVGRAVLEI